MALPTWVDSINGYTGNSPFTPDPMITLDAADIHVTGSSGSTVKSKAQALANTMRIFELEDIQGTEKKKIRIGGYELSLVND